jgi:hypothetical protein
MILPMSASSARTDSKRPTHKHKMTFVATAKVAALRPPTSVVPAFQGAGIMRPSAARHDEPSRLRAEYGNGVIIVIGD